MTKADMEAMAASTVLAIKTVLTPIKAKLQALEQRISQLETKPHVKFCGTWTAGHTYTLGDAATHHGGLWIAKAATAGEPGKDFAGWQLAVKRGSA
jgi:hypothetical protein